MQIKKRLLNILIISVCFTIVGFLVDGDEPNPSIWTNVFEFLMMTILTFTIILFIYFVTTFACKKVRQLFS